MVSNPRNNVVTNIVVTHSFAGQFTVIASLGASGN
jgi:hypothetical protein